MLNSDAGPAVGPIEAKWPDVRRIAVLRGGGLGDLLFAVPAMAALRAAYPDAEIVLLGTELHRELFAGRPSPVTEVRPMPPYENVHEPAGKPFDAAEQQAWFDALKPVDLAVQLHGGGRNSNPFLRRLEPRYLVGARTPDAGEADRWLPFRYYQHEVLRALEVAGLAGARPVELEPSITVTDADRAAADEVLEGLPEPLVVVHPGAGDPRRRWPAERFAEIAAKLAAGGRGVVVIGAPDERELVERVAGLAGPPVRALTSLSMSALVGVLDRCSAFAGNDSGPRHLAAAVGAPTVSVYWMGNVVNAGPLGRSRHRVLISWTANCPVCGVDCTREDLPRCEHDDSFVATVPVEDVLGELEELLAGR
ncbi:glycosyltransferase family 9 protein [Amycolatopsis tucumanensis]|uniref:Glycosyltransferase family 9 protein n=1 Tax=Amycolatopsis tucumanensis TaxID=401106 RepID=A0ABP7IE64_9PSEU|nr:glycosyltransferase family 9 protein [Amycolatopsis tucumanensis]MCF6426864.1 glycosyltransferase family 9 protein [Amycolatopsis tucumanensis]